MIYNQQDPDFDPVKMLNRAFRSLLIIMLILAFIGVSSCFGQSKNDYIKLIKGHGIKEAPTVYAQMLYESGRFNPGLNSAWVHYRNPFGFRLKSCIKKGNSKGYITFDNLEHALQYYKIWQDKYYQGGDYLVFLNNIGYHEAENDEYNKNIISIRNE